MRHPNLVCATAHQQSQASLNAVLMRVAWESYHRNLCFNCFKLRYYIRCDMERHRCPCRHSEVVFTYLTFSYSPGLSNEILTKENTISHVHEGHSVLVLHHLVPGLLLAAARCRVSSLSDANPPTLLVITG